MEAGGRPVPWSRGTTVRWLLGGLLLAIIVPPLLVAPFDPDLKGDGALLAAQAMFDGLLLFVAVGVASDWRFSALAGPLRLLGLRPFRPSAIWLLLGTLVVYYIAAGLFASLVLKPDQEDIGGELGIGNPSIVIAVAAVLMIVLLAPVAEELFFRGFVFAGLRTRSRRALSSDWYMRRPASPLSSLSPRWASRSAGSTTGRDPYGPA